MKNRFKLLALAVPLFFIQCTQQKQANTEEESTAVLAKNYRMEDFKTMPKIDVHTHINTNEKTIINLAKANNFKLLDVAVDVSDYPTVREQVAIGLKHVEEAPKTVAFGTTITVTNWNHPNWAASVIEQLQEDFDNGAVAVKVWKNIGMEATDKGGSLLTLDDPKLDPIFEFIKDQGKVLLSHAGEPKNCWLPLDSMTVNNDRNYFRNHPQYHMYLHPEYPSYEELIKQRDNMLAKNLGLSFIGFHMGSMEWSVDMAGKFLDRFPNANLDLAERMSHTQYQSQQNRKKVRDFFIKYQDRILYATDFVQDEGRTSEELEKHMTTTWKNDWVYFNTDQMITVPQLDTPVQGLKLPKTVVDKIYRLNAERIFPDAWKKNKTL